MSVTAVERFNAKIERLPNECIVWTACQDGRGYGFFQVGDRSIRAHRWLWEHENGPVPAGMQLDHLCRNRLCVNPKHLEPVTQRENILRGECPAAVNARKTHCVRGHELSGANLVVRRDGARSCRTCANATKRAYKARRKVST